MADGASRLAAGDFGAGSFANHAGRRAYKLFVPHRYQGQALPLIVMLHGCTQDPDDFAAGTRMNAAADERDCFVLYPQQSREANASLCWNWFSPADQQRDQGEPSLIAGLTRLIIGTYAIDTRRVFVAGLSAGGAMAVILAATYPELYSAVGVHSGMPYRAAQNLFSALSAMRRGAEERVLGRLPPIRLIVFHGDRDKRVHPRNGEQIVSQLLGSSSANDGGRTRRAQQGAANGRSYERIRFGSAEEPELAEHWIVHGAGHAWSGGSADGSYTDAAGPDATWQMLRFFLRLPDEESAGMENQAARPRRRWLYRILLGGIAGGLALALGLYGFLRGSLPALDGEVIGSGLEARVTVNRDALGIPTVTAADRGDLAYVTGYLHGQDRFFQMDLLRRVAAGELSELFGPAALDLDRRHRLHRFRARAAGFLQSLDAADRALLNRYVDGVNAGLAALAARPFEYGLLMTKPRPWSAADSLLVVWAMYFDLQGNLESRELARGWLRDHSTPAQLAFLLPEASRFDAPLDAADIKIDTPTPAVAPAWFGPPGRDARLPESQRLSVGSNNWAVAGNRTVHGGAIVANDMHLGIRLPHIWYRMQFNYRDDQGELRQVTGVTLPGQPFVVVGSNGHVAWGFTNSYGDYLDLIDVQRDPSDALRIRLGDSWERATEHTEMIAIKDRPASALKVIETSLGPLRTIGGRAFAVHWVAHELGAVNLNLSRLEGVSGLSAAQAVGNTAGMPAQNMIAGDRAGHIGWTIAGPLPDREVTSAASFPFKANTGLGWSRLRNPDSYPRLLDPAQGQLWTANNRQLAGNQYLKIGDGGADLGARARQVRDDLTQLGRTNELAVYGVALDDRALFADEWRNRALRALSDRSTDLSPLQAEFRRLLHDSWDGKASIDSVGYRLARAYEYAVYAELFGAVDSELKQLDEEASFAVANPRWPVVAAALLDERPSGWLPGGRTWAQLELAAIDRAIHGLTENGKSLAAATWGAHNIIAPAHPFAQAMPWLSRWLSAPATPMSGDEHMPKFASPMDGQSERMAVSPGRESLGIFNMPGGASGHPLSPYFLAGHAAWLKGEPTPFLPGPSQHTLNFVPGPR